MIVRREKFTTSTDWRGSKRVAVVAPAWTTFLVCLWAAEEAPVALAPRER